MTWIQGVNEKCLNLKDKENAILRNWIPEKRNLTGGRRRGVCEINLGRVAFEKPAWQRAGKMNWNLKDHFSLQNRKTYHPRSRRLGPGVFALLTPQVGLSMDPAGRAQSEAGSQSARSPKLEGYGASRSLWPGPCVGWGGANGLLLTLLQARGSCWHDFPPQVF